MASAIKTKFSSSTDGKAIKIVVTSGTGTAIHTATNNTTPGAGGVWDEIWLWAYNSSASAVVLTIQFGGLTAPDQNIVQTIAPGAGAVLVIPGLILQNSCQVTAFAGSANVVTVMGFVNQITN